MPVGDDDRGGGDGGGGFLARWARRKREARAEPAGEPAAGAAPAGRPDGAPDGAPAGREDDAPPRSDAEILAELKLPDPDGLGRGDDFRPFMAGRVPEHLRLRALRRLWGSNPVLANLDGLNDYDADFTGTVPGSGVVVGAVSTSYRIGRGLLAALDPVADRAADGHVGPQASADAGAATAAGDASDAHTGSPPGPDGAAAADSSAAAAAGSAPAPEAAGPEPEGAGRRGAAAAWSSGDGTRRARRMVFRTGGDGDATA